MSIVLYLTHMGNPLLACGGKQQVHMNPRLLSFVVMWIYKCVLMFPIVAAMICSIYKNSGQTILEKLALSPCYELIITMLLNILKLKK